MGKGKYGVYGDLLGMGARVAVRSYTHYPQTARVYYRPPPTAPDTARGNGGARGWKRERDERRFVLLLQDSGGDIGAHEKAAGSGSVAEASSATRKQQQAAATAKVVLDATGIIIYGGV